MVCSIINIYVEDLVIVKGRVHAAFKNKSFLEQNFALCQKMNTLPLKKENYTRYQNSPEDYAFYGRIALSMQRRSESQVGAISCILQKSALLISRVIQMDKELTFEK